MLNKIKSVVSNLITHSEKAAAKIEAAARDESLIYDHRTIVWEEDNVNSLIRKEIEKHWLLQSLTFEFEENNMVYTCLITRFGR
jgi:hypothetical protein